ncbi:MAG TPA: MBOAT family O-acyltransferase, partial [Bacteroidia bacterium]|nr:MBOAT family O-acyltransferase [Bacteroidia bacterium]
AYTFQIYFDFSGYSDMAIGMGRMLGFKFPENFDNPYTSASITEFWRKWHMTLGSWMKNYLYIPLGGNRVSSNARLYFNLWLVFLLSGFWHGASWNFIFWGVFHGALLVMERVFLLHFYKKIGRIFSVAITFLLVSIGWVFFRMENFSDAIAFIKKLISFDFKTNYIFITNDFIFYLSLAILFSFFALSKKGLSLQDKIYSAKFGSTGYFVGALASVILFFICLSSITSSTFNPFIYFRF